MIGLLHSGSLNVKDNCNMIKKSSCPLSLNAQRLK